MIKGFNCIVNRELRLQVFFYYERSGQSLDTKTIIFEKLPIPLSIGNTIKCIKQKMNNFPHSHFPHSVKEKNRLLIQKDP